MFYVYQIIVSLLIILSPLIIIFRILKKKENKKRFIEKFSINTKTRIKGNLVWFHGASVGEILKLVTLFGGGASSPPLSSPLQPIARNKKTYKIFRYLFIPNVNLIKCK